jgi:hypothetical protein
MLRIPSKYLDANLQVSGLEANLGQTSLIVTLFFFFKIALFGEADIILNEADKSYYYFVCAYLRKMSTSTSW